MSVRIALIGAGTMASSHAQALLEIEGARVVAIVDPLLNRARKLGGMLGATPYGDYHGLLSQVDAVWICTPPFLHREQAEFFAAAGKHVFIEKPLGLTLADCEAIVGTARDRGVKLAVGQFFHFYPVFQEAHRRCEAGELGELISCWSKRMAYSPPSEMPRWRTDPRKGGGFTLETQVHELDLVAWFCGQPVSVQGIVARTDPRFPGLDSSMAALVRFRNGSIGEISGSSLSHVNVSQRGIVGTKGAILIDAWDHLRLKCDGEDEQIIGVPSPEQAVWSEDMHFVQCIERDQQPIVSGELGMLAVELALATLASSDNNAVISLPLAR